MPLSTAPQWNSKYHYYHTLPCCCVRLHKAAVDHLVCFTTLARILPHTFSNLSSLLSNFFLQFSATFHLSDLPSRPKEETPLASVQQACCSSIVTGFSWNLAPEINNCLKNTHSSTELGLPSFQIAKYVRLDRGLVSNAESTHVKRRRGKARVVPEVGRHKHERESTIWDKYAQPFELAKICLPVGFFLHCRTSARHGRSTGISWDWKQISWKKEINKNKTKQNNNTHTSQAPGQTNGSNWPKLNTKRTQKMNEKCSLKSKRLFSWSEMTLRKMSKNDHKGSKQAKNGQNKPKKETKTA